MIADAALEPKFCSSAWVAEILQVLRRSELRKTKGKICFLVFRLNEFTFHFTFLICTAKKQIDISKPFPNVYFKQ